MTGTKERAFAPLSDLSFDELIPPGRFYTHSESKRDPGFVRERPSRLVYCPRAPRGAPRMKCPPPTRRRRAILMVGRSGRRRPEWVTKAQNGRVWQAEGR